MPFVSLFALPPGKLRVTLSMSLWELRVCVTVLTLFLALVLTFLLLPYPGPFISLLHPFVSWASF